MKERKSKLGITWKGVHLPEDLTVNWDEVIDLRFREIEAELFVVLQHAEAVERQLPQIAESERYRLGQELYSIDDEDEYREMESWIEEFVEEVVPRLYRSPLLVELWAVLESGIIEIANYLQKQQGHSISVQDLRSNNDFERAAKYYDRVLRFPLIKAGDIRERLKMLVLVRNVVAHCNGRIEVINEDRLRKICAWEEKYGEISTDRAYLTFTAVFVESMALAVKTLLEDLIKRVRENTA